jgi:hypothetical protein
MANNPTPDPSEHSRWRPLRLLQAAMDADIGRIYSESGIAGLKPSWAMELLRLEARGAMTITELGARRAAGLVTTTRGVDARSKRVALSAKARRIVGHLAAEWRATEATIADIEAEIPYPLSRVVSDIEEVLKRKSFHDRIVERLAADTA